MKPLKDSLAKRVLGSLIAGAALIATTAYAMPDGLTPGKPGCAAHQGQMQSRLQEQRANRLANLKDKLKLAPSQEAAWDKFAESTQPGPTPMGLDRQAMREEFDKLNTVERIDKMLVMSDARRARMAERAEAIKAFYGQLTPQQQKLFDAEQMSHRPQRMHQRRSHS